MLSLGIKRGEVCSENVRAGETVLNWRKSGPEFRKEIISSPGESIEYHSTQEKYTLLWKYCIFVRKFFLQIIPKNRLYLNISLQSFCILE